MDLIGLAVARSEAEPQTVWERLIDGRRWSEWSPASEWMVVEHAIVAGGYVTIKRKRGRQTAYRIEEAEAPQRLVLVLTMGPVASLRIAWRMAAEGGGTVIRQTVECDGPLRRWLTTPLAKRSALALHDDPERLATFAMRT